MKVRISIEADIDERRFQTRYNPRHSAAINASDQASMPLVFDANFDEAIILDQSQSSLMKVVLNENFVRQEVS